ncbi:Putative CHCH domain-containing protein [[Torrubiella] hemipterigena]|uniref:Putative CHCH domain-containing protein n=1 Tax=[Torrubiella] hemipterigena TaxID=1531966 RepID=A0A0A1TA49_9HYPO|nr:Putative CHCH domain-containing protein [[Torrubiella] hemipterigena]
MGLWSKSTTKADEKPQETVEKRNEAVDDDEPDEWDKRIFSTGCSDENAKMTDCYFEKKDWRACTKEMQDFKECWKRQGNEERTSSKDA